MIETMFTIALFLNIILALVLWHMHGKVTALGQRIGKMQALIDNHVARPSQSAAPRKRKT